MYIVFTAIILMTLKTNDPRQKMKSNGNKRENVNKDDCVQKQLGQTEKSSFNVLKIYIFIFGSYFFLSLPPYF